MADADNKGSGLSLLDAVLVVGGAVIAIIVAFALLHFIVGIVWFAIKTVLVIAVIALIVWLVFRRKS